MTLSIAEALHQAQEAIDGGNYGAAVATCRRLVTQFPSYVSAYQLLGEAYREQGQTADAEGAFAAALLRHQRHPGAYLGLGLIAEDQGAPENALAFCQVAWELAPNQVHLRETLMRVAMRRYGADGDLQLSRAALAQLHVNASRLRRAVTEYRAELTRLSDRVDLQLGLAESLWRLGQDPEAAQICRAVLDSYAESVPALVILADVERRGGNAARAGELLKRLRAADPDGAITASMLARNPRADHAFLELPADAMPDLTVAEVGPAAAAVRIAPAPDFGGFLPRSPEIPRPKMEDLQPITLEELGGSVADLELDDAGLQPITLEELGGLPEDYQPLSAADLGIEAAESFTLPEMPAAPPASGAPDLGGFEDFTEQPFQPFEASDLGDQGSMFPPADEGIGIGREIAAELDAGFDQFLGVQPAAPPAPPAPPADVLAPPTDHQRMPGYDAPVNDLASLAASLESDVAEALDRAGESVGPPPAPTPSATGGPTGYTTMLRSIDQQGLQPFDPRAAAMPEPSATPLPPMDDQDIEDARPDLPQTDEFGRITRDWDSLDDEIAAAMPEGIQRGYTDELRSLTESGLAPFAIEEDELSGVEPFNPFTGETARAVPVQEPAAQVAPPAPPAPPPLPEPPAVEEELIGGLQPFAFEEFETGAPAAGRGFGQGTLQSVQTSSIVPSDEDLEALLALGEDEMPALAPTPAPTPTPPPAPPTPPAPPAPSVLDDVELAREPSAPRDPKVESDLLRMVPGLREEEIDEVAESSIAVTRELSQPAAAAAHEAVQPPAPAEPAPRGLEVPPSLTPGTELFTRARRAKQELVSEGVISGDRELGGPTAAELAEESTHRLAGDSDELGLAGVELPPRARGGSDIASLQAALAATPDDAELRWQLAEALREQGEIEDAYNEYRWLVRHAPDRHDAVIHVLLECVERDQEPEIAHRLLGDIYRRRGDVVHASNHAALALQARRRGGRLR